VGNKSDLQARRVVSFEEGQSLGRSVLRKLISISSHFVRRAPRRVRT